MALPTTGLTLHCRADNTAHLFTTLVGTGVHTGTPTDGGTVQVWDDEADGIADIAVCYNSSTQPLFRSSTPLMKNSCLDWSGAATEYMMVRTQNGSTKGISTVITTSAFTIICAIYPESITSTAAASYDNQGLFTQGVDGLMGLHVKDVSGVKKILGYNYDGNEDAILATITTGHTWIVVFQHVGGNLKLSVIDEAGTKTDATDVASGNMTSINNDFRIGTNYNNAVPYNGRIGEFAIWNTGLTGGTDLADAIDYFKTNWLTTAANPGGKNTSLLGVG